MASQECDCNNEINLVKNAMAAIKAVSDSNLDSSAALAELKELKQYIDEMIDDIEKDVSWS